MMLAVRFLALGPAFRAKIGVQVPRATGGCGGRTFVRAAAPMQASQFLEQHPPTPESGYASSVKAFASLSIYKTGCALAVKPMLPTFTSTAKGGIALETPGAMLFELAPSTGTRTYNWQAKQSIALSIIELGQLLGDTFPINIFHDPGMGSDTQGQTRKSFYIQCKDAFKKEKDGTTTPAGKDYTFSLTVNTAGKDADKLFISLSAAEMVVLRNLAAYSLPHLSGFSAVFEPTIADVATIVQPDSKR